MRVQNEDSWFEIFEKGQIFGPFSGLAPSKLIYIGYVCIGESFDTIFNMGYRPWTRGLKLQADFNVDYIEAKQVQTVHRSEEIDK